VIFAFCGQFKRPDEDKKYDQLWKVWPTADKVNQTYAKFHNSSTICQSTGLLSNSMAVIFRQYIPKKRKCFGITIYKVCDNSGCTDNNSVYLDKEENATGNIFHHQKSDIQS
jgi:hypothetical protein